jgi:hypothetical protein
MPSSPRPFARSRRVDSRVARADARAPRFSPRAPRSRAKTAASFVVPPSIEAIFVNLRCVVVALCVSLASRGLARRRSSAPSIDLRRVARSAVASSCARARRRAARDVGAISARESPALESRLVDGSFTRASTRKRGT